MIACIGKKTIFMFNITKRLNYNTGIYMINPKGLKAAALIKLKTSMMYSCLEEIIVISK